MLLTGTIEIAKHIGLSESTLMELIQRKDFPAEQNGESVWIADTEKIDAWKGSEKNVPVASITKPKAKTKIEAEASVKANTEAEVEKAPEKSKDGKSSKK